MLVCIHDKPATSELGRLFYENWDLRGSFDPIHLGHLLVAETDRDKLGLDQILFMPVAISPLEARPTAPLLRKVALRCFAWPSGHPRFAIDTREIDRGGVSYTVRHWHPSKARPPDSTHFFLMERTPSRLCEMARASPNLRTGNALRVSREAMASLNGSILSLIATNANFKSSKIARPYAID